MLIDGLDEYVYNVMFMMDLSNKQKVYYLSQYFKENCKKFPLPDEEIKQIIISEWMPKLMTKKSYKRFKKSIKI